MSDERPEDELTSDTPPPARDAYRDDYAAPPSGATNGRDDSTAGDSEPELDLTNADADTADANASAAGDFDSRGVDRRASDTRVGEGAGGQESDDRALDGDESNGDESNRDESDGDESANDTSAAAAGTSDAAVARPVYSGELVTRGRDNLRPRDNAAKDNAAKDNAAKDNAAGGDSSDPRFNGPSRGEGGPKRPPTTLISLIGNLFRRKTDRPGDTDDPSGDRSSILNPFAKRDAAIDSMTQGFETLTDLMGGIRDNLERQGERQDKLLDHLARLPDIIEQIPATTRANGETLRALHRQLEAQHDQQAKLVEILDHVSRSGSTQREVLEELHVRVEKMRETDESIAHNLTHVGSAMTELGRTQSSGAAVLESLRDNIHSRDNEIQQVLARQGTRFTVMLTVAIFLSITALVVVAIIGYLLWKQNNG